MPAAAKVRRAAGEMCAQLFGWSARLEIAVAIRKSNHAVGIRDVQELGIVTWGVKRDPERLIQAGFCKSFRHVRLSAAFDIAQHLDLIGATLHHKDVAIRCGEQEPRVAKAAGIQFDPETRRNFWSRVT